MASSSTPANDRIKKIDLLQRALGLRHKLKVHDSMPAPDSHEGVATSSIARWELEDELHAIEELNRDLRTKNVQEKKSEILKKGVKKKKNLD